MGKLLLTAVSLVLDGRNNPLVPPVDHLGQLLDAVMKVPLPGCVAPLDGLGAEVLGTELVVGQISLAKSGEVPRQVQRLVPSILSLKPFWSSCQSGSSIACSEGRGDGG
jgi:hypothetical protein